MSVGGRGKTVVMLGGSRLQVPAIEAARKLGFRVVCADYDPGAPGFDAADARSLTSTLDVEGIEALARREGASFVITSASDAPVWVAAEVSRRLGLPSGISPEDAVCATQKDAMRERLSARGVPVPMFCACENAGQFGNALERFGFDCIAKPADSAASRGVRLVTPGDRLRNVEELFESFRAFSRKGVVMVEQRVTGEEVSVEAMTVDGRTTVLSITDKLTTEPPYFVELGHTEPSRLPKADRELIVDVALRTVEAIGIVSGPSHTEIMMTEDGPRVIETAARLGGDFITSMLVPISTGVNLVEGSVAVALGIDYDFAPKWSRGAAVRFVTVDSPGTIRAIRGADGLRGIKGVEDVTLYLSEGDAISEPRSSNDRVGHVICAGPDAGSAAELAEWAMREIVVDLE